MHLTLTSLYGRYPILQPYRLGASAPENLPYQLYGFDVPPRLSLSLDITCQRLIACQPALPTLPACRPACGRLEPCMMRHQAGQGPGGRTLSRRRA